MEVSCRSHSAHSLIAEPYFHKQIGKLLNAVSKNLLAASAQEETWSKKYFAKSS